MPNQFREATPYEKDRIIQGLESISATIRQYIQGRQDQFFISLPKTNTEIQFPQVFFVPEQLIVLVNKTLCMEEIKEAGIYFGFIKRGDFRLSIEGAEFLKDLQIINENDIIYVNEKGTKAILYGNKIKREMIKTFPKDLAKNRLYFVFNRYKELIAIGLSLIGQKEIGDMENKEDIAVNLIDKGYYLREEQ